MEQLSEYRTPIDRSTFLFALKKVCNGVNAKFTKLYESYINCLSSIYTAIKNWYTCFNDFC